MSGQTTRAHGRRHLAGAAGLAAGLLAGLLAAAPAQAAPGGAQPSGVRHFANCTQMHTVYKGGVARPGATDKRRGGGHARYKPYVNRALYNANARLDRDRDGIACEQ